MVYSKAIIRSNLLYEFKNRVKATKAARRIRNAFDEDTVSNEVARFWFRRCKTGNITIEDELRQGRPETCSNKEIEKYLIRNLRATC